MCSWVSGRQEVNNCKMFYFCISGNSPPIRKMRISTRRCWRHSNYSGLRCCCPRTWDSAHREGAAEDPASVAEDLAGLPDGREYKRLAVPMAPFSRVSLRVGAETGSAIEYGGLVLDFPRIPSLFVFLVPLTHTYTQM